MRRKMCRTSSYWIRKLGLSPLSESCVGYYREVHSSSLSVRGRGGGERAAVSSIYFLQESGKGGVFHRLLSDEVLFYHAGAPMEVFWLEEEEKEQLVRRLLGPGEGQQMQVAVPARKFFVCSVLKAEEEEDFCLFSVVVAPGFDPRDDYRPSRDELVAKFPKQEKLITLYTHS